MKNQKVIAILERKTKNYKRYKFQGDFLGNIYVPTEIDSPTIEVELSPGSKEEDKGK
jgi:hypothetical protein